MNSSTSSSENAARPGWGRWLRRFAAVFALGTGLLYALVVFSDPYSTGRFAIFDGVDIAIGNRFLSNAGRARDPRFDTAIFGNSRGRRFDPVQLESATGRKVVQLSVEALGPAEELAMASAFTRAHAAQPVFLIWTIDHLWCREPPLRSPIVFPYWLYQPNDLVYLQNILSFESVQASFHRIGIRLLKIQPAGLADARPLGDGGPGAEARSRALAVMVSGVRPGSGDTVATQFPLLERLAAFVDGLDEKVAHVFVFPPYHVTEIPIEGSASARSLDACKARVRTIAAGPRRGAVVDWMVENDITRDADNFWDGTHARDHVARMVTDDIAASVRRLKE